ncbi:hypothetical protein MIR68_007055 [Amoeboaphelidium protococcarum]|nr:hypothetical protein MIR68_007055 [Amoeboaphelidium protococcarum]
MSISTLPNELFVHILAHLDPADLRGCAFVTKGWRSIITDESCWKNAFLHRWGSAPFRRLARTWRGELVLRTNLHRIWSRGICSGNVQVDGRIGQIDKLNVQFDSKSGNILLACLQSGLVSMCDATTGRVMKDVIHINNGGGDHQEPLPVQLTSLRMNSNRIIAGGVDGTVTIVTHFKDGGSLARRREIKNLHTAAITGIETVNGQDGGDKVLITGSLDGFIKFVNFRTGQMIGKLDAGSAVKTFAYDQKTQTVIALTADQRLVYWNKMAAMDDNAFSGQNYTPSVFDISQCASDVGSITLFKFFYDVHSGLVFLPVGMQFLVLSIQSNKCVGKLVTTLANPMAASFTCITWDSEKFLMEQRGELKQRQLCVVAAGDSSGGVHLWDCGALVERKSTDFMLPCSYSIRQAHYYAVQVIDIDAFKLTSGGSDGYLKVFDVVSGRLLRSFSTRHNAKFPEGRRQSSSTSDISMAAAGSSSLSANSQVQCLSTSLHHMAVGVGRQLKVWNLDPDNLLSKFKHLSAKKKKNRNGIGGYQNRRTSAHQQAHSQRAKLMVEMKRDVKESNMVLANERKQREQQRKSIQNYNIQGMTEDEMIKYAQLMSLENASGQLQSQSTPSADHLLADIKHQEALLQQFANDYQGSQRMSIPYSQEFHLQSEDELEPAVLKTEENFPPIGSSAPAASAQSGANSKFSDRQSSNTSSTSTSQQLQQHEKSSGRPRKLSLNEFLGSPPTSQQNLCHGIPISQQRPNNVHTSPVFVNYGSLNSYVDEQLLPAPALSSQDAGLDTPMEDSFDSANTSGMDDGYYDSHLSNLSRNVHNNNNSNSNNSVKVVSHNDVVDEDLLYALELSMIEK